MNPSSANTHLGGLDFGSKARRQALLFSFWDGVFANGMIALNETFGTAAAVRLHAPNWVVPLMISLPILLGAVGQFLIPYFIDSSRGRKPYILTGVLLQSLGCFLCAWAGFLSESVAAYAFAALFILAGVSGSAVAGFWMAWMSDLVPAALRGRHFAWRNAFFALANLSCSLLAGIIARQYNTQTAPWGLFASVFTVSALFRFLSFQCMSRQGEIPVREKPPAQPLFAVHRFRPPPGLTKFAVSTALFQGVASLASPFFNVWYLRDLRFSYLSLAIATACTVLGSILALWFWGRLADKRGHIWALRLSGILISLIPLPYLVFETPHWIWAINVYGGACWAGYNLSNFNCILEATGEDRKSHAIAYASIITGLSLTGFGVLGGWLADRVPVLFTSQLQTMFLISGVLRFVMWLALISRLKPLPSTA